jgi:hypothetical protein
MNTVQIGQCFPDGRANELTATEALRIKQNYDKQVDEIYNKWKDSPLLEGFPEDRAKVLAVVLENQHLVMDGGNMREPFKKIVLELVAKIYKDFAVFDMVSVQPMLGPCNNIFYTKFEYAPKEEGGEMKLVLNYHEIAAKTRNLQTYYRSESIDELADQIRDKISREVMTDLRNNCGTVATFKMPENGLGGEDIYIKVAEISGVIFRKTMRGGARWIVTGPDLAKIIYQKMLRQDLPEIKKVQMVGTWCSVWKLIVDPLYPKNEILVGASEPLLQGYVYAPYVMLTETPIVLDPYAFVPRHGLMHRYGKYLFREGGKEYARIKINVESEQPLEYVI